MGKSKTEKQSNPLVRNCDARKIVRRWLAETGRLQLAPGARTDTSSGAARGSAGARTDLLPGGTKLGAIAEGAKHCSYVEFATELRRELEPSHKSNAPAFASKAKAAAYVRMVAASISEEKLPSAAQETARQDREHGYRLVSRQRAERKERERLDAMSRGVLAESADSYRERAVGEWPIVKRAE
jgi:hypothetical protein